jgi:plastocyanin
MRRSVLALSVLALAAACGGDEASTNGATAPTGTTGGTGTGPTGGAAADCVDQTSAEVFTVELADFEIVPACLVVTGDQSSEVTNTGNAPHTFTVLDTGIDVEIAPGETSRLEATGLEADTYTLQCQIHPSMEAELRVE